MATPPTRHVMLTGQPGTGKTTLVEKVVKELVAKGIPVQGFFTEEVRGDTGKRKGFDIVTLSGQRAKLARIPGEDGVVPTKKKFLVGPYQVELNSFESLAIPELLAKGGENRPVFVIDEVGKMEMFSETFKDLVVKILDTPNSTVLCTIPIQKGRPIHFVETIRDRKDGTLFTVSTENRDMLVDNVVEKLIASQSS